MRFVKTLVLAAAFQSLAIFAIISDACADLLISCAGCSSTTLGGTTLLATQSLSPPSFTLSRNPNNSSGLPEFYGVTPVLLIPNNTPNGANLSLTETMAQGVNPIGVGNVFCDLACSAPALGLAPVWSGSELLSYFGNSRLSGPSVPFADLLAATKAIDPGATGYFAYVPIGGAEPVFAAGNDPTVQFGGIGALPAGTIIVALATGLNSFNAWTPSAVGYDSTGVGHSLILTGISPSVPEPATWAMMILGFCGLGVMACRRRSSAIAAA